MSILSVRSSKTLRLVSLHLEQLEDRLGPSVLDFTALGAWGVINAAVQDFSHDEKIISSLEQKFNCDVWHAPSDQKSDHHAPSSKFDPFVYLTEFCHHEPDHGGSGSCGHGGTTTSSAPASLSGVVYLDANDTGMFGSGDSGIAGVTVTLTGTTSAGKAVSQTATTAADGTYSFTGLQAGTYTLTETPPSGYNPGTDTAGTVNGTTQGTVAPQGYVISSIPLKAGQSGVNYNFGQFNQGPGGVIAV